MLRIVSWQEWFGHEKHGDRLVGTLKFLTLLTQPPRWRRLLSSAIGHCSASSSSALA
jgi:hypothetical protein